MFCVCMFQHLVDVAPGCCCLSCTHGTLGHPFVSLCLLTCLAYTACFSQVAFCSARNPLYIVNKAPLCHPVVRVPGARLLSVARIIKALKAADINGKPYVRGKKFVVCVCVHC